MKFGQYINKAWFVTLMGCFCTLLSHAQTPAALIEKGDESYAAGQFEEAYAFFRQAYDKDSTVFDHIVKLAEATRMMKEYPEAIRLYQLAYDRDEGKLFPESVFWMATLKKMTGDLDGALLLFKKYTKKNTKIKKGYFYQKSLNEIESCTWAISYKEKKTEHSFGRIKYSDPNNQSENFNFEKEKSLLFSHFNHDNNLWEIQSGTWADSVVIDIQTLYQIESGSVANVCFDTTGYAYFTKCENGLCQIFKTKSPGRNFEEAELLRTIDEEGFTSTMPSVGVIDGTEYLFFVSNRPGGKGKMDIWYARSSNGTFINPENAGDIINTVDDELTPFYRNDQLYFSSDWHKGFGGTDIFSIKGTPGSWGFPTNLGKPLNSSYNDVYYKEINDTLAFLSSNRPMEYQGATCCNDIFYLRKKSEKAKSSEPGKEEVIATLEELNAVLPVTLYFHNDEPNPRSLDTTTTINYYESYASYIDRLKEYSDAVTAGLKQEAQEDAISELNDFFDLKVKKGYSDLRLFRQLLMAELEKGNSVNIQVRGFASPRAKSDYNKRLTQRRIASLVNDMKFVNDSSFVPYLDGTALNGAKLTFEPLPFGEDQSAKEVSDDLGNTKASIYSRGARLERKIEIQKAVIIPKEKADSTSIGLDEEYFNFGKIGKFGVVHHDFVLKNITDHTVTIDSVVASCGCTEPVMSTMTIPPGESAVMDVGFNPFGGRGREIKFVVVYIAGEKPRVITIEAEIE